MRYSVLLCAMTAGLSSAGVARADRVFLTDGGVIEGKATRKGDRVVVQVEAGEMAVPSSAVVRIERANSPVSDFEARYAALRPGDVKARLALADYCRANDLPASEKRVLRDVIEIEPDNPVARERLGYVKTNGVWMTHADAMQEKGLVLHEGRWVPRSVVEQSERLRLERQIAEREAERARIAQRSKEMERAADEAAAAERARRLSDFRYGFGYPYAATFFRPAPTFYAPAVTPRSVDGSVDAWTSWQSWESSMSVVKTPYRRR